MWGDVVIQGLWSGQVEAIIDVIIGDSGVDHTSMSQWKHSCFVGKLSIITNMVRTVMNNGNTFFRLFFQ